MDKQIAFSTIQIKSFDPKTRKFTGVASSVSPDRMQDVVEPDGMKYKLPLPFLYQHDSGRPVGQITSLKNVGGKRVDVEGFVQRFDNGPATLKERVDVAAAELESGMVRGLSIGFNPIEYSFIKDTGGIHFTQIDLLEISMVTIPANADATIRSIKSAATKTALGQRSGTQPARAGAQSKGNAMKYTKEALAGLQKAREEKQARMTELVELKSSESRQFSEDERNEFNKLGAEIADLDDEIAVCKVHVANLTTSVPATETTRGMSGGPTILVKKQDPDDKFKGQAGTRMIIAKALAHLSIKEGNYLRPSDIAAMRWGKSNPMLVQVIRANEVPGGGSGSGEWFAELVQADTRFTADFVDYLYSKTVFDQLPLREIPANVAVKGMDGAFTGYWTGESKPIKASAGSASTTNLTPLKVAALAVLSNELIRDSSPSAEALVRDGLEEALTQVIDTTFLGTAAASAGVSPAGMLNGLSAGSSAGPDAVGVRQDIGALLANFITAKTIRNLQLVTQPALAANMGLMTNALGQPEFAGVTVNGGMLQGYPLLVGDNVGSGDVIMLNPDEIWKIGDLGVKVSVSQDAMIEQSSAPTGATDTPVAASQAFTSMFQEEATAFKVVRPINFQKRNSAAVAYIGDAAYTVSGT